MLDGQCPIAESIGDLLSQPGEITCPAPIVLNDLDDRPWTSSRNPRTAPWRRGRIVVFRDLSWSRHPSIVPQARPVPVIDPPVRPGMGEQWKRSLT